MKKISFVILSWFMMSTSLAGDILHTKSGDVRIKFLGHASLYFEYMGKVIHIDPWSSVANYDTLPPAHLILITHHHRDHLDTVALKAISRPETHFILAPVCLQHFKPDHAFEVLANGDSTTWNGIKIKATAAYNIKHKRPDGTPYHPKGVGNGYILQFADKRIYVAGDTENIPEMAEMGDIDIAFLPVNLPFTMAPEMLADALEKVKPKVLYPYHYGQTDLQKVQELIRQFSAVEIRIR